MSKLLIGVNLENKQYGLTRVPKERVIISVAANFRKLFHEMGYDCSLLTDNEILAFEDLVYDMEHATVEPTMGCREMLIEVLDFMCKK